MKRWMLIALFLLSGFTFIQCNKGGGSGGVAVTTPSTSLIGTYQLIGFRVDFENGQVLTQNNYQSWRGTLRVGPTSYEETFVVNSDTTETIAIYHVTFDSGAQTSGTFDFFDLSGNYLDSAEFLIQGNEISIGVSGIDAGVDFVETDRWRKISDKL